MRDENAVNGIGTQADGFATAVDRLAAINEEPSLAQPIKKGGVIALGT